MAFALLVMFCLSICLGGCAKKPGPSAGLSAEASGEAGIMGNGEVPGGRLMELGGGNGQPALVYFDYAEKTFVPICARADCTHEPGDMNCPANILAENLCGYCVYQGQLWYLKESFEGRLHLSDPVTIMLCRADLTGENAEVLYTWQMKPDYASVLYDGYFYVIDAPYIYDENSQFIGYESQMIRVDLETGEITEIEAKEETQESLYHILGAWEGKLYYRYYSEDRYPGGAVICYDCETQEKERFPLREGDLFSVFLEENYLIYEVVEEGQEETVYVVDLADEEEVAGIPNEFNMAVSFYGDEILFQDLLHGYARYDLKTGEYQPEVQGAEFVKKFQVSFSTGDGYVGHVANDEGYFNDYAYISREDFDRGGTPTPLTKNGRPIG